MYVCICNAVTDHDIAGAVREGAVTMAQLEDSLLVGTCCGKCRDKAGECLERFRPARPALSLAMSA
jgi:bacterioferritin-associated ferredoxin